MNETTHEQLSALLDGELPRDELRFLLRRLDSDPALAQRWSRYHLASAALKRQPLPLGDDDRFVASILSRLDISEKPAAATGGFGPRLLRWAGGGAIAATVAVAALVATKPPTEGSSAAASNPIAAVPAAAQPATATAVELHSRTQQLLPAGFVDYTLPASFESIVPNYTPRYSAGQVTNGASEAFVPYVLVVGSRQMLEPQPVGKQDSAAKQ